jgi:transketolase
MRKKDNIKHLKNISNTVRKNVIKMLSSAGSGHPGGSLSSTDILVSLYFSGYLNISRKNYKSQARDVVILSAGHYCPALYAILAEKKFYKKELLDSLRKFGSPLLGHPKFLELPGVENSGGSLGQGISLACGYAISAKRFIKKKKKPNVFCIMGDGEQNEGQVWEAAMFASHNKLNNLCVIIDVNKIQIDGYTKEILNSEPLNKKYESFNWRVERIDGHNFVQLTNTLKKFINYKGSKPTVIIADTIAGKGLKSIEGLVEAHGKPIFKSDIRKVT